MERPYKRPASESPEEKQRNIVGIKQKEETMEMEKLLKEMEKMLDKKLEPITRILEETKETLGDLKMENMALKAKMSILENRCVKLEKTNKLIENKFQENNLVLVVPKKANETPQEIADQVFNLLGEKPEIQSITSKLSNKARQTIIIKLNSKDEVYKCLKKGRNLKGTPISMRRDLVLEDRIINRAVRALKKDILTKNPNQKMKIITSGIICNDTIIEFRQGWAEDDQKEAIRQIKELFPETNLENLTKVTNNEKTFLAILSIKKTNF